MRQERIRKTRRRRSPVSEPPATILVPATSDSSSADELLERIDEVLECK